MEKDSTSHSALTVLQKKLDLFVKEKKIPKPYGKILAHFFTSYHSVVKEQGESFDPLLPLFDFFLKAMQKQFISPYRFSPIHRAIHSPLDYYQFGIDFILPLVNLQASTLLGLTHLKEILRHLDRGENVILFANHQTEADPQAISVLLRNNAPSFAANLFFVAGTRVTSDPLAIPFSMGRNLICIYSKKYIATPPEKQREKQLHNKRTLELMVDLLNEGGHAIYVAPSGGRDRADSTGQVEVAPFDPQSIELFHLMAKKGKRKTHFYSLALSTYHLLPPPETTEEALGESRSTSRSTIHLAFGKSIEMDHFPGSKGVSDKKEQRKRRAAFIWDQVKNDYMRFSE